MSLRTWGLIVLLSVLWGGSFFFVELALRDLGPLTVVCGRVGLGALALFMLATLRGERMPGEWRAWRVFFVMGALNNLIPFALIAWAQTHIDSGLAAILNATTPLFTVILAHLLTTDERMTPAKLTGVAIGFLGVTVMIGVDALRDLGFRDVAQLAVLGAAVSYALAGIYGRRLKSRSSTVAAAGMLAATTLMLVPMTLVLENPFAATPGLTVWAAMVALGLLSTAAAYVIYFRVLNAAGPTNLLLVTFLIPVTALLLGSLVLGERPTWQALAGMGLIFLGLAAVDGRFLPWRWRAGGRTRTS